MRGGELPILRIEHPVPDFDAWKKTFDSDPLDGKGSGVRRHRVMRPADDPNYALVANQPLADITTPAPPRRTWTSRSVLFRAPATPLGY